MPTPYDFHLDDDDPTLDPEVELRDIAIEEKAEEILAELKEDVWSIEEALYKPFTEVPWTVRNTSFAGDLAELYLVYREEHLNHDGPVAHPFTEALYEAIEPFITEELAKVANRRAEAYVDSRRNS